MFAFCLAWPPVLSVLPLFSGAFLRSSVVSGCFEAVPVSPTGVSGVFAVSLIVSGVFADSLIISRIFTVSLIVSVVFTESLAVSALFSESLIDPVLLPASVMIVPDSSGEDSDFSSVLDPPGVRMVLPSVSARSMTVAFAVFLLLLPHPEKRTVAAVTVATVATKICFLMVSLLKKDRVH